MINVNDLVKILDKCDPKAIQILPKNMIGKIGVVVAAEPGRDNYHVKVDESNLDVFFSSELEVVYSAT